MTAFSPANLSFQDRYKLTDLINGTEGGDSVAYRQLKPVEDSVSSILTTLSDLPNILNQFRVSNDLQDQQQVLALIAQQIANIPEAESRLASIAVKTVYQGSLAEAQASIATMGLTASSSGNIDDANLTCVLVDSPIAGETGVYQMNQSNQLVNLNTGLFAANMGYYTRFYVIESGNRPGREFAITALDAATNGLEVEEIPYEDEYTGLGPIVVSNLNKTVNIRFTPTDFIVNNDGEFALHPAMKAAIEMVPGLNTALNTLSVTVADLTGIVTAQGQSISQLQQSVQGILDKWATAFANVQHIFFEGGLAKVKQPDGSWTPAPLGMVQEMAGGTADRGLYRISHSRGIWTLPSYAHADAMGNPKRAAAFLDTEDQTSNSIDLWVEKYTNVVVSFPAGLTAAAFA